MNHIPKSYLLVSLLSVMSIYGTAQDICFDGNYCPFPGEPTANSCGTASATGDEYTNSDSVLDPGTDIGAGGTCDILQLFVDYEPDGNVYLSFVQANQGQACYSFYFDSDCDPTTGSTEDLLDPNDGLELTADGADIRFLVCVQQDNVNNPEVETWDGSAWVANGSNLIQGLAGLTNGCGGDNEAFVETQIPLGDLLDVCNPEINCGNLRLTTFLTFAGGSFNSQECDVTFENLETEIPADVMADLVALDPVCTDDEITFDASGSSGIPGILYEWDFDGDGTIDQTTTSPTVTNTYSTEGTFTVTVSVSDPNSICPNSMPATAEITLTVEACVCMIDPPTVLVTENTCDPEADGFYEIGDCGPNASLEFSIDQGVTWSTIMPTYPVEFLVRCTEEVCNVVDLTGLDASDDAVNQVNMGTVMIGNATLSINQTFNGSSSLDENEITVDQTSGDLGISSGVSHTCNENTCGLIGNSMNNLYNFTEPVCNLMIDLWDLDRDDEMVLTASGPNGPISYVVNTIGSGVDQNGNIFSSNNPNVNYPSGGDPALGMFSVTFDECVTQISIDYYDASDTAGNGGSYTIVFQEGCTFTECSSEEIAVEGNPQICCPADLIAVLNPIDPTCLGSQINFDATGSTSQNVEYNWDFENDGTIDLTTTVPMSTFTYPNPGIFTVSLTVVDPTGACPEAVTTTVIEICGQIEVTCPPSPITILEGESISPDVTGSPTIVTTSCTDMLEISFDDVVGPGDCDLEEVITRIFTISDDCGTSECIQIINVEDIDELMLIADLAIPDPVCFGDVISLDASGSSGFSELTYDWDFDGDGVTDQTTTTGTTMTSFPNPGTFTVFVTVSAPTSPCPIPPASTSVEIIICDQIMVTCPVAAITIVDGESITTTDLGEPQFTTNECNPNPQFTFVDSSIPGSCPLEEIITRTFTIADNCGDHECIQTINVELDNPADINALPLNPEICLGDVITLDASASIGDGLSYCWDVGIGSAGCDYTTATATHVFTEAGTYIISLMITDQFGCTDDLVLGTVTVYEAPELIANVSYDPCTLTLTYDASASVDNFPTDNLIYTWDFGDGNTSGNESGTHIYQSCAVANVITITIVDPDIPFAACNSDQMVFTIENDTEPPVVICPPATDLACGDPIPVYNSIQEFEAAGGTVTDNCNDLTFEIISQDTIDGLCPYIYQVEVLYRVTDQCFNSTECSQSFNLLPNTPSAVFPEDVILSCGDDFSTAVTGLPQVTMNSCTRPATFTMVENIESGTCPGDATVTRTWTLVDDCGNEITHEQIIVIINDIEPTLEGPPDITIDCLDACDPSATGGIAIAVDFCMPIDGTINTVTITFTDEYIGFDGTVFPGGIVGYIIRTFVGTDLCGNEGIYIQTISIMRGESTVLTCNDQINVSLGYDCEGVTPDFLLEAPEDTKYFISLEDGEFGFALGPNETFDSIDWSVYIEEGETVQYTITDFCGNTCWGHILLESNIIPDFESQCTYLPGQILSEAGAITGINELSLNDMVSLNEDPDRSTDYLGTVTLTDSDCQDAFILGTSGFRYNAAIHGGPIDVRYVDLILYFVNTTDGTLLVLPFSTGNIPVTQLTDLLFNPGTYDVFVASADHNAIGDYNIHIEVTSCLPRCETICGASFPDEFITIEEILDSLNQQCYSTLIGDIKVESHQTGDMCEGIVHVETYSGMFNLHGEMIKREIITQAYVELPIDLDVYEILAPNSIDLECGDEVTPEFIVEQTGDPTDAYPYYLDFNHIKIDTICLEEIEVHYEVPVDTVQEMANLNGVWVLLDIVKKETRDSIRCLRRGPNPDIQYQEILLDANTCNVLIDYTDVVIQACAGGQKIIRDWSIIDWCDNTAQLNLSQTLEVKDSKAPIIEKWDDVVISIDPWSCAGVYKLPSLTHTDNCEGTIITESWQSSEGQIVDNYALDLWLSEEPIEIYLSVSDDCGNTALDTFNILVEDHIAPVAVCKDNLNVTLTSAMLQANAGEGKIYADIFDAGSHDSGCDDEIIIQVRRVEGCCSSQCIEQFECIETDPKTGICIDSTIVGYTTVFDDFVKFCCDDIGSLVKVELKITDKVGNFNSCIVDVEVVDKTQSILVCDPITVDCLQDVNQMDGPVVTGQYCDSHIDIQLLNESEINGNCGLQQIIKEWYIDRDGDGDFSSGDPYCQQQISVESNENGLDPYSIKWPKHFTGEVHIGQNYECDDSVFMTLDNVQVNMGDVQLCGSGTADTGEPIWCGAACSLIAHSLEVDTIFSSDACFKIINRWTVIDWCKWEANGSNGDDGNDLAADEFIAIEDWAQGVCANCADESSVIADPVYFKYTSVKEDGYYTFDQILKVVDDSAPVIDVDDTFVVQTSGGAQSKEDATSCTGDGLVTATALDFCNGNETAAERVDWTVKVTKGAYTIDIQNGSGSSMTVNTGEGSPGDIHIISWTVTDGCGNTTEATTQVSFDDQVNPTPFCIAGVTTTLPDGEDELVIWAPDVDFGSYDNCTDYNDLKWAIVPEGVSPILPGEDGFDDQFGLPMDCDQIGSVLFVDMWVFDANGNGDFCNTSVIVNGSCDDRTDDTENDSNNENETDQGASADIGGSVLTTKGESIENTLVSISSSAPEYPKTNTVSNGKYGFTNNPIGFNYSIEAEKDVNHINGVSTFDILLMQRHILGLTVLDSPYKLIAADINNDQNVSGADIVEVRKLILGYSETFDSNQSWRFVDAAHEFISNDNPWPFTEQLNIQSLALPMLTEDFLGVKIGDLNENAIPSDLYTVEVRYTEHVDLKASIDSNNPRLLQVVASHEDGIQGLQFEMESVSNEMLAFSSSNMILLESNFRISNNEAYFSWHNDKATNKNESLSFQIEFGKPLVFEDIKNLNFKTSRINPEMYVGTQLDILNLKIDIIDSADGVNSLSQNWPNPFNKVTQIEFYLDQDYSEVVLSIFNTNGQLVWEKKGSFKKGSHQELIQASDLGAAGIYQYAIKTKDYSQTKRLILAE